MAEGSNGRRRFSDKWGKHELDVLAVLSSAFPQWLTSRQIAQRVKAYADSYGELADQAAKAAFAKQFQRDRAKLAAMGIAIESSSRSIHPSRRDRTSRPTVCSLVTSLVFVCCSGMRICRFWLPPTTWPVLCRFPRLLRMRRNIRLVPRRVFLRHLFRDLVLTPLLLDWEPSPFPTNWSKSSISGVSRPRWMLMASI